MAESDFTIEGLDEFIERFSSMIDNWEAEKRKLLNRIATVLEANIKPEIPVDTSRLADSFFPFIEVGGADDIVEFGTNVEYALYVNDGHVQHKRFLPCRKVTAGGKTRLVYDRGSKTGVMLQEKYVAGKFYIEKGCQNAKPEIQDQADKWMRYLFIKYGLEA